MIKLSYNEALRIQRSQLAWYRRSIGLKGLRTIRKWTKPCLADIHPDDPISIFRINELIPRGGEIEQLIRLPRYGKRCEDVTTMALSDAIRKGML